MAKSKTRLIDERIKELDDRRGVPTWYHDGMVCTGESYEALVKAAVNLNTTSTKESPPASPTVRLVLR